MDLHDCGLESGWAVLLRDIRIEAGMPQAGLAERLGVSRAVLCNWELGRSAPLSLAKWNWWANLLGLPDIVRQPPKSGPRDDASE